MPPTSVRIACAGSAGADVAVKHGVVGQHGGLQAGAAGGLRDVGSLRVVSQTVHDDIAMSSAPRMLVGAPTMPTIGPRGSALRNLSSTSLGLSFLPTISRAEARFSTGCTLVADPDERRATGLAQHDLRVTEVGRRA